MIVKLLSIMNSHATEVASGDRFEFGKNWTRFLGSLNEKRIAEAEKSLRHMLEVDDLHGRRFLDIGSGREASAKFDNVPWSTKEIWMDVAVKDDGSDFALFACLA